MSMSRIRSADIRKLLGKAPATVGEVAALLKMPRRDAQVGVWYLCYNGQAKNCGSIPNTESNRGRHEHLLFELTPRGRFLLKKQT